MSEALEHSRSVDLGGRYRPLVELGRGGMARIFLAESLTSGLGRLVVLKVLDPEYANDPEMLQSFRREAELGARLNHPNIVQVFEVFDRSSGPVMVMEYLEGLSVAEVQKHCELPLAIHLSILAQTLAGLHHLHEMRGIDGEPLHAVHRDVSPQNIIVLHEGVVKVLDFGIAKVRTPTAEATRTGIMKGKVRYMAPEQIVGEKSIDRRADIFAVGTLLWEAFANRRMWGNELTNMDVLKTLVRGNVPSLREAVPDIPASCEELVMRATAPKPQDRFATALEMQVALEACIEELGLSTKQRQVAEFMAEQFGELRESRQKAVSTALAKRAAASTTGVRAVSLLGSPTEDSSLRRALGVTDRTGEHSVERPLITTGIMGQSEPSQVEPARRSRTPMLLVGAALVTILGGVGWAALSRGQETPAGTATIATSAAPAPRMIRFDVAVSPSNAEVILDGQPVSNPTHTQREASARRVLIEVRAPGHVPERHSVSLDGDVQLDVKLVPMSSESTVDASANKVGALDTPAPSPPRHNVASRPAFTPPPVPRPPPPAPAATTSAQGEAKPKSCNPPYTLSADGVKTYKPECF